MNPTTLSQFEAAKTSLVDDLARIIQKAAKEAVQYALSQVTLGQSSTPQPINIRTSADGKFEAMVGDRLVKRSRRRDLVRYARTKGFSAA